MSDADASSRPDGEITRLLEACSNGEHEALDRLMPLVYDDLRAIAHRRLRLERSDHTLNTTAIVHEAYLKLVDQATATWRGRAHFFAVSARVIRNLLIDYARERKAAKRGGDAIRLPLDEQLAGRTPRTVELLALDEALTALGRHDKRLERVVECRFFGGMSMKETAETLGVSLSDPDSDADLALAPLTRTGLRPLTPEYASPEQVRGEPITTASDVYQLGVLLYRLLTGERPYGVSGSGRALEEAITETRPTPPSAAAEQLSREEASRRGATPARLGRRLRGDLDVIVLKALRKDPARRYGSAVEMAEDVRRHLQGRPILARRASRAYRVGKFLQRNAWFAPVAAALALLVGRYIATLLRHGRQLEAERNVARDVQRAFVSFFTAPDSVGGLGLGEGRRDLTVREAILEGADRVGDDLADRPAARAELFGAMAQVLADLDEQGRALQLAEEALEIEEALHGPAAPQVHETLLLVGNITSDPDSARALLRRHLELSRALYGERHPAVATSLEHLGLLEHRAGNPEESVRLLEQAVDILREHGGSDPVHSRHLAWALGRLADSQVTLGRPAAAVAASREAYETMRAAHGPDHSETAIHGVKLAAALKMSGDVTEARRIYEANLPTMEEELGPGHTTGTRQVTTTRWSS